MTDNSSLGETDSKSSVFYIMKKAIVEGIGKERKVIIDFATLYEKNNEFEKGFVTMTTPITVLNHSLTDNQLINIVIKAFGIRCF